MLALCALAPQWSLSDQSAAIPTGSVTNGADMAEEQQVKAQSEPEAADLSGVSITYGPRGIPIAMEGRFQSVQVDDAETLFVFLQSIRDVMRLPNPAQELELESEVRDEYGAIYRLSQTHEGLPVYGCFMTVAVNRNGSVTDVTANLIPGITQGAEPVLQQDAVLEALPGTRDNDTSLVYYAGSDTLGDVRLCWMVYVESEAGYRLLDAETGAEIGLIETQIF